MSGQPAVFLDRDGVLIREVHYLSKLKDMRIYDDVPAGIKRLKAANRKLIMVTNQSGIARGYFSEAFVHKIFVEMNRILAKEGAALDAMYFCPHHPDGREPLNIHCDCRKPKPGMIRQAYKDHGIDLRRSYMLGDKICDIELAIHSGIKGILLETGYGASLATQIASEYPKTPIVRNFTQAVDVILGSL